MGSFKQKLLRMKLLTVLSLSLGVLATSAKECEKNPTPCSDLHDIAKIICKNGEECTLENGDLTADENLDYLLKDPISDIDLDLCIKKCEEQNNTASLNKCEYYRWGNDRDHNSNCSLQTSCGSPDPWCDESNYHCSTGQIGCTEEGEPEPKSCSLSEATVYTKNKFHVVCLDLSGLVGEINIYDDTMIGNIPPNTVCMTSRRCAAWPEQDYTPKADYYRKLAVYCDGTDGSWQVREDSGSADLSGEMIKTKTTIVEQDCSSANDPCPNLNLSHIGDPGFSLICDYPLQDNTLSDPNSCILLCDNHWTMAIDCGLSEMGDKTWLDDWGDVVIDNDIKC